VFRESEIITLESQVSLSRTITLPPNIRSGDYAAIAQVRYEDSIASSSEMIHVLGEEVPLYSLIPKKYIALLIAFVLLLIIIFVFLSLRRRKKEKKSKKQKKAKGKKKKRRTKR